MQGIFLVILQVTWEDKEHKLSDYEVLVGCKAKWVPTWGNETVANAFPCMSFQKTLFENILEVEFRFAFFLIFLGGEKTIKAGQKEVLFCARMPYYADIQFGRVQKSKGVCHISYAGKQVTWTNYDILICEK